MVANFSEETITLQTGAVLGIAQDISENLFFPTSNDEDKYVERDHIFSATEDKQIAGKFSAYMRDRKTEGKTLIEDEEIADK
jgi:hypothetical protein